MTIAARTNSSTSLTDEQRIKRICELLWKAMLRREASRALSPPAAPTNPQRVRGGSWRPPMFPADSDDAKIVNYLALVGVVSPGRIRETLGLSRWCFHTALHRLLAAGQIVTVGRSRAVKYRLSEAHLATAKVELN